MSKEIEINHQIKHFVDLFVLPLVETMCKTGNIAKHPFVQEGEGLKAAAAVKYSLLTLTLKTDLLIISYRQERHAAKS